MTPTDPGKPQVVIQSPPGNAQVVAGVAVEVVTTAVDGIGVGRIDLKVNDLTVSSAEAPSGGLLSFSAVHPWMPVAPGPVTVSAVAYRIDGAPSDPMQISVLVLAEGASAAPYATYAGAVPSYRASAVPAGYPQPTYKANPTYVAVAPTGYVPGPTATTYVGPTPTAHVAPTPTYHADPTLAVEPTPSIAPSDSDYTWTIPYKGTSAVGDYVSYPNGDGQDRVDYSVNGMNPSTQNQAYLTIEAKCEGVGIEHVIFKLGTREIPCNEFVWQDLLITYDSGRTGRITVIVDGAAYVKWTLTGSTRWP